MKDESPPQAAGRVFISYRHEETAWQAVSLFDRLADRFGRGQIFKDIDSIQLGDDFVEVITTAVGSCDVLLALIGEQWLTITDEQGRPRLDNPDDFVRLEIEAALTRNVRVIPILVEGARMPRPNQLPPSLAKLARRQGLDLSPARFDFDISRLQNVLDTTLADVNAERVEQLQRQIRERTAAQDWDAVLAVNDQLAALDPDAADPDRLAGNAREQITRRRKAEQAAARQRPEDAATLRDNSLWRQAPATTSSGAHIQRVETDANGSVRAGPAPANPTARPAATRPPKTPPPDRRRYRAILITGFVVLLAASGGVMWALLRASAPPPPQASIVHKWTTVAVASDRPEGLDNENDPEETPDISWNNETHQVEPAGAQGLGLMCPWFNPGERPGLVQDASAMVAYLSSKGFRLPYPLSREGVPVPPNDSSGDTVCTGHPGTATPGEFDPGYAVALLVHTDKDNWSVAVAQRRNDGLLKLTFATYALPPPRH